MSKTLILYSSYEGNTEKLAIDLATTYKLSIEKIDPIKEFNKKGFLKYALGGFQVISKKKPKLKKLKSNLDDFDTIILASPVWAGSIVPTIYSFIKRTNLNDKKLAFFYTHQGGHKNVVKNFKKALDNNPNIISICDCLNVKNDYANQKEKLFNWYKSLK